MTVAELSLGVNEDDIDFVLEDFDFVVQFMQEEGLIRSRVVDCTLSP